MLNHRNPTFVRLRSRWLLTFIDIFESNFAKFFCIGIDRRASEGAVKARVAVQLA